MNTGVEGFCFVANRYAELLRDIRREYTRKELAAVARIVLRQFASAAVSVDKMEQPSQRHQELVLLMSKTLEQFVEAMNTREVLIAKMNPDDVVFDVEAMRKAEEKARLEKETRDTKEKTRKVRKQRRMVTKEIESGKGTETVREWQSRDIVDMIPSTPPYPAFFFKKLSKPCIVRKAVPATSTLKRQPAIYLCIFDNGDVSYLATDANSTGEDKVRANLRELSVRGKTRRSYTVHDIEEGLLKRGFDPAQVAEIAKGHSMAETVQFGMSTGTKVKIKSIPPGKRYDGMLGIILGTRLSMSEQPIDVTSFVGETTGKSHNIRVFKVFLEDETTEYIWGEEVALEISEGTHEALVLDELYKRLEVRKQEEADARLQEFSSMLHDDYADDDEQPLEPRLIKAVHGKTVDDFKHRVKRLVKDDD